MSISRAHPRDSEAEGDELSPHELREQMRVQRELLAVLHADGAARTRQQDGPGVKLLAAGVPFVVGVLIGVLGTIAVLSGRVSTLEAESKQHGESIAEVKNGQAQLLSTVQEISGYIKGLSANATTKRP